MTIFTSTPPRPRAVTTLMAAVAAMVFAVGLASQPGASASSTGWDGGFEDGTTSAWKNEQESSPERISLVKDVDGTGRALDGQWAARVLCGRQDQGVAGSGSSWRTELTSSGTTTAAHAGTESWWSWDLYVGSDFAAPPVQGGWAILTQFHGGTGSPVVAFEVDYRNALLLRTRGGDPTSPTKKVTTMLSSVQRQHPYQIEMHANWSTGSDGRVRVWIDGALVADQSGPNLYDGHGAYLKMGCYRSDSTVGDGTIWIDGIRRSNEQPTTTTTTAPTTTTTTAPTTVTTQADVATDDLVRVSDSPDRSHGRALNGTTTDSEAYVFLDDPSIDQVTFSLDGAVQRTESTSPFDFEESTSTAAPLRPLNDGAHTIEAHAVFNDGSTATLTAAFTSDAGDVLTDPQPDPLSVTGANPAAIGTGLHLVQVQGTGFGLGTQVQLEGGKGPAPKVLSALVASSTMIEVVIEVPAKGRSSRWDVRVGDSSRSAECHGCLQVSR